MKTYFLLIYLYIIAIANIWAFDAPPKFLTYCGQAQNCMQDFKVLANLVKNTGKILEVMAPKEEDQKLEINVVELKEIIERCNLSILDACQARSHDGKIFSGQEVLDLIKDKLIFESDPQGKKFFKWDEEHKKLYTHSLMRKYCNGAIAIDSLTNITAILFFNTQCSGVDWIKRTPILRESKDWVNTDLLNNCAYGLMQKGTILTNKNIKKKFTIMMINYFDSYLKTPNDVVPMFDSSIYHEFVHYEYYNNPKFRKAADKFLKIHFDKIRPQYKKWHDDLNRALIKKLREIASDSNLTIQKKNQKIKSSFNQIATKYTKKMIKLKLPSRHGVGTNNYLIEEGIVKKQKFTFIPDYPQFKKGSNNISFKWNPPFDNRPISEPKHEYLAYALTMYRYDRKNAKRIYTKKELEWLKKHWQLAYLSKK